VNLKVPIVIFDELSESVIRSTGNLDLASGEIFDVRYDVDRPGPLGLPAADEQYEFTSGVLSNDGKDVEFRIDVDVMSARYYVNPTELLELKVRLGDTVKRGQVLATMASPDLAQAVADAQKARVQGVVILEALIDDQGSVANARVLRSVPLLDAAALDAVSRWRFTPTEIEGRRISLLMTVTVNFTLSPQ